MSQSQTNIVPDTKSPDQDSIGHCRKDSCYIEIHPLTWEGITISISWCPAWLTLKDLSTNTAHLEIRSVDCVPLPVTETGYKSLFLPLEHVEAMGGPVSFVLTLLDQEATSETWQNYLQMTSQPSLF